MAADADARRHPGPPAVPAAQLVDVAHAAQAGFRPGQLRLRGGSHRDLSRRQGIARRDPGRAGLPDILVGWLALALFVPLAATSSDIATRALGRSWKRLHRLVYPAAILTFLHWVLASFDPTTAYIHIAILAAIELVRIGLQCRQRVT